MKRFLTGLAATALFAVASSVIAFDFSTLEKSVTEYTLKNGLKLIILERHDAPVVSFVTGANVGSVDDPKGYTGLAHMFEHMAFKGTSTLGTTDIKKELASIKVEDSLFMLLRAERNKLKPDTAKVSQLTKAYEESREASYKLVIPNEFSQILEREGGANENASTFSDYTLYYTDYPSNRLELWMSMESERFLDPVLREMYKERDVVAEERRMRIESNPVGHMVEEFLGLSFKVHPYGIPGIGSMSDIQYYSRQEAKAFFDKYYGPSNLVIAIVGDVDPKKVIAMAEKYFGRIPFRPAPERIATIEPEQSGEKRMVIDDPSQPLYLCGFHVPDGTHPDRPALDAALDYLGGGRTSLLYKNLVKGSKQAVDVGAFAGFPGNKYATMAAVYAFPSTGHTAEEVETEVLKEIEKLKDQPLTNEELAGIKARAKASVIRQLENNQGLASQLVTNHLLFGDWRELFRSVDQINAVTADDIQRVAKQYLTQKNRVVTLIKTVKS